MGKAEAGKRGLGVDGVEDDDEVETHVDFGGQ
jgi:hypothetical protein